MHAFTPLIPLNPTMKRFGVPVHTITKARHALIETEALDAVRGGRPLPAGFTLPNINAETTKIYDALRRGDSMELVAKVNDIVTSFGQKTLKMCRNLASGRTPFYFIVFSAKSTMSWQVHWASQHR